MELCDKYLHDLIKLYLESLKCLLIVTTDKTANKTTLYAVIKDFINHPQPKSH